MGEWGRNTPWRQGALLSEKDLRAAGQVADGNCPSVVGVVISHDCDIAQEVVREPDIEVIVATVNPTANGSFSHGKNSRTLQVNALVYENSSRIGLELSASGKFRITKEKMLSAKPIGTLETVEKEILQRWLASRYRRSAFSDEFNSRLNSTGLRSKLETVLKKFPKHISGIYFLIDDGEELEHHGEDDPFDLRIYVLYSTEIDPTAARKDADEVCEKIKSDFSAKCKSEDAWKNFELTDCIPISDTSITFAQARRLQRWNGDHISYRTVPAGIIDDGDMIHRVR